MSSFAHSIRDFWRAPFANGEVVYEDESFVVVTNPDLSDDRRLMVLDTLDGKVMAALTPEVANHLGLHQRQELSEPSFRQSLKNAGVVLHDADCLFYFSQAARPDLLQESPVNALRQLTEQDRTAFEEFQAAASEQDLDDAYVELGHWAVFGSFENNRLVSAASMYPWRDSEIADIGILTLPQFRKKGHARRVVRSISRHAYEHGYEPQYRCQLDNHASRSVAVAADLTLFGKWEVISPGFTA
ncbi:GNAT family N-acetyltransferase [Arthrobacter monumenti]